MADPIPEINYPGVPLEQKFQWMQSGPGVGGIEPTATSLGKLSPEFEASADHINQALPEGVTWRGAAATAATESLGSRAQGVKEAGQAGRLGYSLIGDYGTSFAAAKTRIAAPVEQDWFSRLTDAIHLTDDHAKIVAQNQALDDAANRALKDYEDQARRSLATFPDPNAPPPQSIGSPPPAASGAHSVTRGAPGAPTGTGPNPTSRPGPATPAPAAPPGQPGGPTPPRQFPPTSPQGATPPSRDPSPPLPGNPGGWADLDRRGPTTPSAPSLAPGVAPSPQSDEVIRRPDSSAGGATPRPLLQRPSGTSRQATSGGGWMESEPASPGSKPPGFGGAVPPIPPGGGRGGGDAEHRNDVYIPSDSPFRVDLPEDVLDDPVIGLENPE